MTSTKMFVPKTITVGYQNRKDTYTGKLAYVIYTDDKGKLRKETSWKGWCTQSLGRDDYDNEPTSGFVLNKGVGGARESYGWNARNEYIRVYDPRNFEFEISVRNLLFILQECSSIKGKGLEGEFVYAWDGVELVLLPADSKEYEECVKHTKRQSIKFDKNDIKEGYSYLMKDGTEVMYLGRHNFNNASEYYDDRYVPVGKKHVFFNLKMKKSDYKYYSPYIAESGFTKIAEMTSSTSLPQFPDEYEKFKKSKYSGDITEVALHKVRLVPKEYYNNCNRPLFIKDGDKYYSAKLSYERRRYWADDVHYILYKSTKEFVPEVENNAINIPSVSKNNTGNVVGSQLNSYDFYKLKVVTEKGKTLEVW